MQALHLCFCVGAILAPLATEPFLAKKICILHMNNTENNLTLHTYNTGGMFIRFNGSVLKGVVT